MAYVFVSRFDFEKREVCVHYVLSVETDQKLSQLKLKYVLFITLERYCCCYYHHIILSSLV